ncbi:MAG TPA: N-acetyltransferase [Longimicrobiaceae bacterium]|jgi:ribosomal protein S18 acetylase RimI-like enzyme
MKIDMDVKLRPVRDDDLEFLFRVYAGTREEELAPVPWSAEQKEAFLRMQFDAQHAYYQEHYAGTDFAVVLADGEPVGRLYLARWTREHRIVDIAILPAHRNRGLGSELLRRILEEADGARKPVSIHVEMHNPVRRLYDRLGFVPVEERGMYLLMERPVGGGEPA